MNNIDKKKDKAHKIHLQTLKLLTTDTEFQERIKALRRMIDIPEEGFALRDFPFGDSPEMRHKYSLLMLFRYSEHTNYQKVFPQLIAIQKDFNLLPGLIAPLIFYLITNHFGYARTGNFSVQIKDEGKAGKKICVEFYQKPNTNDWKILKESVDRFGWESNPPTKSTGFSEIKNLDEYIKASQVDEKYTDPVTGKDIKRTQRDRAEEYYLSDKSDEEIAELSDTDFKKIEDKYSKSLQRYRKAKKERGLPS